MQGDDEAAGAQPAVSPARDLQPSGEPHPHLLGAPVPPGALGEMDACHGRQARRLHKSIDRRMADRKLVRLLSEDGFAGPRYAWFEEELARYGISVLRGWMHSGFVFTLVASRGFALHPHELELEALAQDGELREELATMTVARALPRFRRRALVEGGWTYEGGASIATYFMGACAYEFPNEYRRHRSHEERWRRALERDAATTRAPVASDAATEVLGRQRVLDDLEGISDPRMRAALALTLDDYTQEEIRLFLGAASRRAIEGLLYRWRTKARREEGEDHE
ncbi:hypothetical protein GCM10011579_092680 [Streptomyces albiflavescens]|uniref:Uncharacterized protein n=1 Tax=Streptomyces albiflavescens TaxID=1623582 RepID=A0A918DAJ4_9ACTN|nr:hypothetical protein [Streptomyces albiflavescens]GGN93816.1 hypothetical protein GCM10011579_092680 [Streptomyces albiflavescens]